MSSLMTKEDLLDLFQEYGIEPHEGRQYAFPSKPKLPREVWEFSRAVALLSNSLLYAPWHLHRRGRWRTLATTTVGAAVGLMVLFGPPLGACVAILGASLLPWRVWEAKYVDRLRRLNEGCQIAAYRLRASLQDNAMLVIQDSSDPYRGEASLMFGDTSAYSYALGRIQRILDRCALNERTLRTESFSRVP